ncbi:MAG TPA: efflux RND transporter periplasmic adaptor subunit [Vicinamibacterales bacterium]|nr:efflux RND transporter periplasmic adaptor subunit [Vicinamibacterales bacterium]
MTSFRLGGVLALAIAAASCSGAAPGSETPGTGRGAGRGDAAVPVAVAAVREAAVPLDVVTVGTAEAESTVDVRPQITGQLIGVHFTEGRDVERGQLMFTIDPRPFELALRQAQASLDRNTAQAKNLEATRTRQEDLLKRGLISQADYDTAATSVASVNATLEGDRTSVETAKLNLQYTKIAAPVSGRAGALQVHQGALLRTQDTSPLVTINQLAPIRVSFAVPGQYLSQVRAGQSLSELLVTAHPQGADPGAGEAIGRLSFVDNAIDTATGTIRLKATFPNQSRQLWPGQILEVSLRLSVDARAVAVPTAAVQNGQQGQFVFVVGADNTVAVRPVTIARTRGDLAVVAKGLQPGENVVTDGQLRLLPGSKISVKPQTPGPAGPK